MADADIPSPSAISLYDENIRKILAVLVLLQFVAVTGFIMWFNPKGDSQMVLGAEISFMSMVLGFYFGSSSGSVQKSQLLAEKGNGPAES